MKNLISIIVLSLLFFLSAVPVRSQIIAGASAPLIHQTFIDLTETQQFKEDRLRIVIESVLKRYNSPMSGESEAFVKACVKYQINCYLLPSIAGIESTFGKFILTNSYNPFGWGRGYMVFKNWSEAIETVAKGLKNGYINKGAETVEQIGPIYSESPTWATRVNFFVRQFEKEAEKMTLLSNQFPVEL